MTDYEIPADLRPWVKRTAPLLTAEDWPSLAQWHEAGCPYWNTSMLLDLPSGVRVTPDQARALLAYRDEVARGLTKHQRRMILKGHVSRGPSGDILWRLGFVDDKPWMGEVARVLREDGER